MSLTFFTPGPAQLYPTFEKHLQTFVSEQLGSISHRSQQYRDLHKFTVDQLRTLLNVPDSHAILFLGSASEAWERILFSCVELESFHLVNGSFSKKFYDYSLGLCKYAHSQEKPMGEGFSASEVIVPEYAELICTTHNETSSGVQMPVSEIHKLKQKYPDKLIAVDIVSSAPYPELDFNLIDTAFFSVQKAFGLPAGLGVWIVNEKCLRKAEEIKKQYSIGAHNDLPTLWKNAQNNETPATPNVMGIYLLGKIAEDFNKIGVKNLRKETEQKADLLYKFIESTNGFSSFVKEKRYRSQTVIVTNTDQSSAGIIKTIKEKGMVIGSGYGQFKSSQLRIANFPATSLEQVQSLIHELKAL
ncbi:aminotransferase class V-fold PLP-dependent enzyme [Dyadobacter frigoris]|uniref:phosphoserine transaminase n=1 Tax=Dyadobacter frigoris TaxID=2576211 RepID=A0A4U6DBV4_9BACT|nr:aminotransferase class V-fold PLP-dependent enzyme [Dyadobacter frigoris]TKT91824.1 aminotransferase class V-fold PLP-dependent enzyme [Dyadobacter frigoris]GLU53315.1 aminotransferase [Dyadobacter frigoris]